MGCYVNPPGGSKENWLKENATKNFGGAVPSWNEIPAGEFAVCLVDNGPFTAAAVAYSEQELNEFADPSDDRLKEWFTVKQANLQTVSDIHRYVQIG